MKKFKWNQLVNMHFVGEGIVSLSVPETRKSYEVGSAVLELASFAALPQSLASLRKFVAKITLNQEDAVAVIEELISADVLVPDKQKNYEEWLSHGWRQGLLFHLFTKNPEYADWGQVGEKEVRRNLLASYLRAGGVPLVRKLSGAALRLPPPLKSKSNLGSVLLNRRTFRAFHEVPTTLSEISSVLWNVFDETRKLRKVTAGYEHDPALLAQSRFVAFDAYVVMLHVEDVKPGVYRYEVEEHLLTPVRFGQYDALVKKLAIGQGVHNAAAAVFLVADFKRYMWRYRASRALRNLFIEAGSLAQRVIVAAEAFGFRVFLTPALRDGEAQSFLKLKTMEEPLYFLALGKRNDSKGQN